LSPTAKRRGDAIKHSIAQELTAQGIPFYCLMGYMDDIGDLYTKYMILFMYNYCSKSKIQYIPFPVYVFVSTEEEFTLMRRDSPLDDSFAVTTKRIDSDTFWEDTLEEIIDAPVLNVANGGPVISVNNSVGPVLTFNSYENMKELPAHMFTSAKGGRRRRSSRRSGRRSSRRSGRRSSRAKARKTRAKK
jgi:hypothetical protein